jgi:hypothetical protein
MDIPLARALALASLVFSACAPSESDVGESEPALHGHIAYTACGEGAPRIFEEAMRRGRLASGSSAFRRCVLDTLSGARVGPVGPYLWCAGDPAPSLGDVLDAARSSLDLDLTCDPSLDVWASSGALIGGRESVVLGARAIDSAKSEDPRLATIAASVWREALHARGFRSEGCGFGLEQTMPYIVEMCLEMILTETDETCSFVDPEMCPDGMMMPSALTPDGEGMWPCECVIDPRRSPRALEPFERQGGAGVMRGNDLTTLAQVEPIDVRPHMVSVRDASSSAHSMWGRWHLREIFLADHAYGSTRLALGSTERGSLDLFYTDNYADAITTMHWEQSTGWSRPIALTTAYSASPVQMPSVVTFDPRRIDVIYYHRPSQALAWLRWDGSTAIREDITPSGYPGGTYTHRALATSPTTLEAFTALSTGAIAWVQRDDNTGRWRAPREIMPRDTTSTSGWLNFAAVARGSTLALFAVTRTGSIVMSERENGTWSTPRVIAPRGAVRFPDNVRLAAVARDADHLEVFALTMNWNNIADRELLVVRWDSSRPRFSFTAPEQIAREWPEFHSLPEAYVNAGIHVLSWDPDHIELALMSEEQDPYSISWDRNTGFRRRWARSPQFPPPPSGVNAWRSFPNAIEVGFFDTTQPPTHYELFAIDQSASQIDRWIQTHYPRHRTDAVGDSAVRTELVSDLAPARTYELRLCAVEGYFRACSSTIGSTAP